MIGLLKKRRKIVLFSPIRGYHERLYEKAGMRFGWGKQTVITRNIAKFAGQFKGNDLQAIKKMVGIFANPRIFRRVKLPFKTIAKLYAKRTADDIIYSKAILVIDPRLRKEKEPLVNGCADFAPAVAAAIRAKNIKADVVRQLDHSYVIFALGGKEFIADPLDPNAIVREFGEPEKKLAKMLEDRGAFARGKDLWSLGIKSINDFQKYLR